MAGWLNKFKVRMALVVSVSAACVAALTLAYVAHEESGRITLERGHALHAVAETVASLLASSLEERERETHLLSRQPLFTEGALSSAHLRGQLKEQGGIEVFIVSANGYILHPHDPSGQRKVPAALAGDAFSGILDWESARFLVGSTRLSAQIANDLAWRIVVRQPLEQALAPVEILHRNLILIGGAGVLFFALLALMLARRMAQPLENLSGIARRIADGEHQVSFPTTHAYTEIENLSLSLGTMQEQFELHRRQHREQQKKLEERSEQLDLALESAQMGSYHWDIRSNEIFWSAAYRKVFGIGPETPATYANWLAALVPEDRVQAEASLQKAMLVDQDWEVEYRIRRADGMQRWILARGRFYKDENDRPARMEGVVTDITERKWAEAELIQHRSHLQTLVAKRTEALQLAERELRASLADKDAILNSEVAGFWITQNRVTQWLNRVAAADLGYTPEELIGHPTRSCYLDQENYERFGAARLQAFAEGRQFHAQWQWLHKDGRPRWFDITAVPIPSDPETTIWVAVNIDALKQTEAELLLAKKQAEAANDAKSAFLATMSHEIRTPLNAVIGSAFLLAQTDLSPEQQRCLDTIEVSSKSLLALINDILDLSKIEAGELDFDTQDFLLPEVVQDLRSLFLALATDKGIALEVAALPDGLPAMLQGDSARLRQMLNNLLSNAIKFTAAGRVSVAVSRVEAGPDAHSVRLRFEVTDTGIGIAPDVQARLFQPFTQADASTSRRFGGTGLGLSIVKRMAELMRGSVGVESRPGAGSTFWLELPFTVADRASSALQRSATLHDSDLRNHPGHGLDGMRVLVVDDSAVNLQVMNRILLVQGALPTLCHSGQEALAALDAASQPVDLILMDLQMPDMDGIETTLRIRRRWPVGTLPILALTAGATTTQQQIARKAGMDDFLTKPVDPPHLVRVLRQHAERPRAAASAPQPGCSATLPSAATLEPSSGSGNWPDIAGIDAVQAQQAVGGDAGFLLRLLQGFCAAAPSVLSQIEQHLQQGRIADATAAVHRLRGEAGNLGAHAVFATGTALEAALRAGATDFDPPWSAFKDAIAALLTATNDWQTASGCNAAAAQADSRTLSAEDRAALPARLHALDALLGQRSVRARRLHGEIKASLQGTPLAADYAPIGQAIEAFDFPAAQQALQPLLQAGFSPPPDRPAVRS